MCNIYIYIYKVNHCRKQPTLKWCLPGMLLEGATERSSIQWLASEVSCAERRYSTYWSLCWWTESCTTWFSLSRRCTFCQILCVFTSRQGGCQKSSVLQLGMFRSMLFSLEVISLRLLNAVFTCLLIGFMQPSALWLHKDAFSVVRVCHTYAPSNKSIDREVPCCRYRVFKYLLLFMWAVIKTMLG